MKGQVISLPRKDWSDGCSETNYDCMQNGGITFIFVNKETFFSRFAFFFPLRPSSFIDLSAVAAFDESKNALRYLKLKRNVCRWGDGVGDVVKTERALGSVEPPSWATIPTPNEVQWRSPGQLTAQLIPLLSTFGEIQTDHIINLQPLARYRQGLPHKADRCLLATSIHQWVNNRIQVEHVRAIKSKMEASILVLPPLTLVIVT